MEIKKIKSKHNKKGFVEMYIEECECGKVISSLSKNQCEYNFKAHKLSCKYKEVKKDE